MLSIIYITMNRSKELIRSIRSCEEHISINHEYIIVDNGSTDDTEFAVREVKQEGIPIFYVKQDKNMGVAGGRNIGFLLAHGTICYFIDDDAIIKTEGLILDEAYSYIISHDEIYAMSTNCYDTAKEMFVIGGFPKNTVEGKEGYVKGYTGFSHFIAKCRYHKEYLYPSNLMYGSEELYFALTAYKVGMRIWYYEKMCILHIPSSVNRNSRYWQSRNAYINTYVIKKYFYPKSVLWLSNIVFVLRAIKNEKMKFWSINKYLSEAKKRYIKKYDDKLTLEQYIELIRNYRFLSIL